LVNARNKNNPTTRSDCCGGGSIAENIEALEGEKYEKRKLIEQRSKKVPCGTLWLLFSAQHAQI